MNRKMHGCQLIKSLDNILQFLSSQGSCDNNWLNDVAQKIENAQMISDKEQTICPADDDFLSIENIKDMNEKFFENEKITLQVIFVKVIIRILSL